MRQHRFTLVVDVLANPTDPELFTLQHSLEEFTEQLTEGYTFLGTAHLTLDIHEHLTEQGRG